MDGILKRNCTASYLFYFETELILQRMRPKRTTGHMNGK